LQPPAEDTSEHFLLAGWVSDPAKGTLTANQLRREDAGEYTCTAENSAGRLQASARLSIIIK
jgi:hypothetical protein